MLEPDFWRNKRVFVTGHTGFKGAWMVLLLRHLGAEVHGFALAPSTEPSIFEELGVRELCAGHTIGDIRDLSALSDAMRQPRLDVAIHMAAQAIVSSGYTDPVGTLASNVMGTAHFLEACRTAKPALALVISSDKCYRNEESGRAFRETDPLGGKDPYSASKAGAELVVDAWRSSFLRPEGRTRLASGRAGNVIGGGDWSIDRLLPDAARSFAAGERLIVRSPESVRPWQHVLDPLAGYLFLVQRLAEDADLERGWNFGPVPPRGTKVGEVAEMAVQAWGGNAAWDTPADYVRRFAEAKTLLLDCRDAVDLLGWKPRLSTEEAVHWTMRWYRSFYSEGPLAARRASDEQIDSFLAISAVSPAGDAAT